MKRIIVMIMFLILLVTTVFSGPFGINFGMTKDQILNVATIEKTYEGGSCKINPNIKSPLFNWYSVRISPTFGVISITAQGISIKTNVYGDEIRNEFDKMKSILAKTYGKETSFFDYLKAGSIWKEQNEWMTSLKKKERVYTAYWLKKDGANLSEKMNSVMLEIVVSSTDESDAWLYLSYQSEDYKAGINEIINKENENVF